MLERLSLILCKLRWYLILVAEENRLLAIRSTLRHLCRSGTAEENQSEA